MSIIKDGKKLSWEPPQITFNVGGSEMIKITSQGFFIRGNQVPQDSAEAKAVYKAFKNFLSEYELRRSY